MGVVGTGRAASDTGSAQSTADSATAAERTFVHPGLLHTEEDFTRMKAGVDAAEQPWLDGWNTLLANGYSQLGTDPRPLATVVRGGDGSNFAQLYIDIQRTYQLAVRWKVSGDTQYADQAVVFLNAWSSTLETLTGNADRYLAAGIYGYQFANAGEIMRTYPGWAAADFERFQNMILNVFYPHCSRFLVEHNDAVITNYWANWDQASLACILATGILCDRQDIYQEALDYYKYGQGNGAALQAVYHVHPGNLGQWQESGRDQGHCTLGIGLAGVFCEMAWNQGDDMYGYDNNRFLAGAEYVAKSNLTDPDGNFYPVPWLDYRNKHGLATGLSTAGQGHVRPVWESVYNHYVKRRGLAAPYVQKQVESLYPEGNLSNGDQLGYGTLLFSRELEANDLKPSGVTAYLRGDKIELSWWGVANADSYTVKRSASGSDSFVIVASDIRDVLTYSDTDIAGAASYDYVITAVTNGIEGASSDAVRISVQPELLLHLTFDEASGTEAYDRTESWAASTLVNGAAWATGRTGGGVSLDGVDNYIRIPEGTTSSLADFTIATNFYAEEAKTWSRVFDFGSGQRRWMMLTLAGNSGNPVFSITTIHDYNAQKVDADSPFPLNQWVHVAVTLSGNVCTLYINGAAVGSNSEFSLAPYHLGAATDSFLGRSQYSADPYTRGRYDDFRIWHGALSAERIAELNAIASRSSAG
ncbi:hypothetical protein BIY29_15540 [Brenneria alni]|uniref:Alginate lyase domain-containing protein n=1 Tax=Brenneria alni TaxID=71656 RepID=A0A421DKU0_9GAMM|nr:hypothetical protein BIY29_15540 [Brenneria alni]